MGIDKIVNILRIARVIFETKHYGCCVDKVFGLKMEGGKCEKKTGNLRCHFSKLEEDGGSLN